MKGVIEPAIKQTNIEPSIEQICLLKKMQPLWNAFKKILLKSLLGRHFMNRFIIKIEDVDHFDFIS